MDLRSILLYALCIELGSSDHRISIMLLHTESKRLDKIPHDRVIWQQGHPLIFDIHREICLLHDLADQMDELDISLLVDLLDLEAMQPLNETLE